MTEGLINAEYRRFQIREGIYVSNLYIKVVGCKNMREEAESVCRFYGFGKRCMAGLIGKRYGMY